MSDICVIEDSPLVCKQVPPALWASGPLPVQLLLDVMEAGAGKEFDPSMVRVLRDVAPAALLEA